MTKTEIAKRVASLMVGFGTGKVVKEIIDNNTADPENVTDKVRIVVGSYVLGAIVADAAKDWTDQKIEAVINWWTDKVMSQFPTE